MMIVELLNQGGTFALVALGFGLIGGLLAVVAAFGIGFAKWRVPMTVGWLGLTAAASTSVVGGIVARMNFSSALTSASVEMRQALLASSIAQNQYTMVGMLMVLSASFTLFTLAAAIPTAVAVGEDGRLDLRGVLSAAGGAVGGLLVAVIGLAATMGLGQYMWQGISFLVVPMVTLVVTVATLVACVRVSDTSRLHQGRTAASRIAVGVGGSLAVLLTGYLFASIGVIQAFKAVAVASADTKAAMLTAGLEVAGYSSTTGWFFALVPLCAGVVGSLHIVGRVEGRQWIGAGVAGIQVLTILGAVLFVGSTGAWMLSQLVSSY